MLQETLSLDLLSAETWKTRRTLDRSEFDRCAAAVEGSQSVQEAWERLVTGGWVPAEDHTTPRRCFTSRPTSRVPTSRKGHATWDPKTKSVVYDPPIEAQWHPGTVRECVALASSWSAVLTLESIAQETRARLSLWEENVSESAVWSDATKNRTLIKAFSSIRDKIAQAVPEIAAQVAQQVRKVLIETGNAGLRKRLTGPLLSHALLGAVDRLPADQRAEAVGRWRGVSALASLPDPVAPVLYAHWLTGCAMDFQREGCVLALPARGAEDSSQWMSEEHLLSAPPWNDSRAALFQGVTRRT